MERTLVIHTTSYLVACDLLQKIISPATDDDCGQNRYRYLTVRLDDFSDPAKESLTAPVFDIDDLRIGRQELRVGHFVVGVPDQVPVQEHRLELRVGHDGVDTAINLVEGNLVHGVRVVVARVDVLQVFSIDLLDLVGHH